MGKGAKKRTHAAGEIHASELSMATDPAALEQQQQLAERQALAALTAAERGNVNRVLIGDQANAFGTAKSGKSVHIDVIAITKGNKYMLSQAMDQSVEEALIRLEDTGAALGHEQVTTYTLIAPEQITDPLYSVEKGIIYEGHGSQKTPYLIHGKPVQVVYTRGQGASAHPSP